MVIGQTVTSNRAAQLVDPFDRIAIDDQIGERQPGRADRRQNFFDAKGLMSHFTISSAGRSPLQPELQ